MRLSAAAVVIGASVEHLNGSKLEAAAAAAWLPAFMSWREWYWAAGLASPAGTAKRALNAMSGLDWPSGLAVGAIMMACALPGWAIMRYDRRYRKKHGRSLLLSE